jgi:glycosidase
MVDNLKIFLVMVSPFNHSEGPLGYGTGYGPSAHIGTIKGIRDALPYIKSTGANAIWHTPVFDSKAGEPDSSGTVNYKLDSTGYYTRDYFNIDPLFGTLGDYVDLVQASHKFGMKVIMDVAVGHNKGLVTPSPVGNYTVSNPVDFNDPQTTAFFIEFFKYWVSTALIDGYRLDQAYQAPNDFWIKVRNTVKGKVLIAEVLCSSTIIFSNGLGSCLGSASTIENLQGNIRSFVNATGITAFNFPMMFRLRRVLTNINMNQDPDIPVNTKYIADGYKWEKTVSRRLVLPLSNHDFPRFGNMLLRGNVVESESDPMIYRIYLLAFSFLTQYTGAIQWFYNDEIALMTHAFKNKIIGDCLRINLCDDHSGRLDGEVLLSRMSRMELNLYAKIRELMKLRDKFKCLSMGTSQILASDELLIILKELGNESILYIMNASSTKTIRRIRVGIREIKFKVLYPAEGMIERTEHHLKITVEPKGFMFLLVIGCQ